MSRKREQPTSVTISFKEASEEVCVTAAEMQVLLAYRSEILKQVQEAMEVSEGDEDDKDTEDKK